MVLEGAFFFAQELLKLNAFVLIGIVVVGAFVIFKILGMIMRVLITGLIFGTFPVILSFLGFAVPLTASTILWSIILGIITYLIYMSLSFTFKMVGAIFSPIGKAFSKPKTKKVVVKKEKD